MFKRICNWFKFAPKLSCEPFKNSLYISKIFNNLCPKLRKYTCTIRSDYGDHFKLHEASQIIITRNKITITFQYKPYKEIDLIDAYLYNEDGNLIIARPLSTNNSSNVKLYPGFSLDIKFELELN